MKKQSALHHPHLLIISSLLLFHFFFFLVLLGDHEVMVLGKNTSTVDEFKVGVVLDSDKLITKMGLTSISMALSDFYASKTNSTSHKRRLALHTRDSNSDKWDAASAAIDLMKNLEVQAIIGPTTSSQAYFLADLGNKAHVPIISFTATSPSISPSQNQYFIRTAQNDSSQVNAIAAIVKAFGWREVVLMYEDTEYGNGVIPYLTDAFQEIDTRVPYRSVIPTSATDDRILHELYKLMTMQTRVFVVHMTEPLGFRVFQKAKMIGMMNEGYSWIITDGLANFLDSFNSSFLDSMQGVLGVLPYIPKSEKLEKFRARWKKKFLNDNPADDDVKKADLNIYPIWAYDTMWALASAVGKLETMNRRLLKPKVALNLSDIAKLGVSQKGPDLLQEISKTKFPGLSGEFNLINGQLQSTAFKIINVVDREGRQIGFWNQSNGILWDVHLFGTMNSTYLTSKKNLGSITWPGHTPVAPKGWEIPTNGKKLRIGVPVKDGFGEFVKVKQNPTLEVRGYCIDVFEAVIKSLPYAVRYEFIPFLKPNEKSTGSYDDLITQVYNQNYDAVVGDVTITANRSDYVDFTLPYTESGVSMIVPVKEAARKQGWIFLKPLKLELWLTTAAFFVFIGLVIWVLEHRINDEFRGPPSYEVGTMFWFSFSTLVSAHKEILVSNYSRFVVIIWVFVVLVLTQSYTANLASILTVHRLEPTVTDVKELIKNGNKVGYQEGSFVGNMLEKMGFDKSNLRPFSSAQDFEEAFSRNNNSGRIVAAFEEIPFIKLLMTTYCGKYTMVGPIIKTGGFGFVFPRGSPLLLDISRTILNVTEGPQMIEIEQKWLFRNQKSCPDPNPEFSSSCSLGLESFWGLFLIAGLSSTLALLIFLVTFLYRQRKILTSHDKPNRSIRQKFIRLFKHFDRKDSSSHAFRKSRQDEHNIEDTNTEVPPIFSSSSLSGPRISNETDGDINHMESQPMPEDVVGSPNPEICVI